MALRLQNRELPAVSFRRVLPDFLGPKGEECFIAVNARASGPINIQYTQGMEQVLLRARTLRRSIDKMSNDPEVTDADYVKKERDNTREIGQLQLEILYDACVIDWESNIVDGDKPIKCNKENFVALADQKIPELVAFFVELSKECAQAGNLIKEEDEETAKN